MDNDAPYIERSVRVPAPRNVTTDLILRRFTMAHYRGTVVSTRSAEETFDYMADFANAAEWDPGTASAERLTAGEVGLGSAFRLYVRVGSRTTPLDYRIVAFEQPDRVVLLGESATLRSEDTVTVVPDADGGSILTYDADLRLKGFFALANPLLGLFFRRIGDKGAEGLRRTLGGPFAGGAEGPE